MQVLLAAWLAAVVALGAPAPAAGDRTVMSDHPRTLHVAAHAAAPGDGSMTSPYPHITRRWRWPWPATPSWSARAGTPRSCARSVRGGRARPSGSSGGRAPTWSGPVAAAGAG